MTKGCFYLPGYNRASGLHDSGGRLTYPNLCAWRPHSYTHAVLCAVLGSPEPPVRSSTNCKCQREETVMSAGKGLKHKEGQWKSWFRVE